jgi:spore coat protein SA
MKILMICTEKLPVPNIRGGAIQTYICGVSPIIKQQHEITIISRTDPELANEEVVDGIHYIRIESQGILDIYARGIVNYLSKSDEVYDIIHIFNRPKLVLPVSQRAPASRIILSMHNDMFKPEKISRAEGKAVIEQTETIITISQYIAKTIIGYFPEAVSKVHPIYSGVDLSRFAPWKESDYARKIRDSIRSQYNLGSKKVILFVGRLSRNKGPHVLVKAMSHIKHRDAVLVIVGAAWYSDDRVSDYIAYTRALANRSPIPVITTGFVDADDVHKWFCAADVFVCTSIWEEPLARVHYEAMAAGLPFITTNRGGNPEVILNDNGLLVQDPEDPIEYANQINRMLSNMEETRKMGIRGRRLVEQHFTWNNVADNILSVWENERPLELLETVENDNITH